MSRQASKRSSSDGLHPGWSRETRFTHHSAVARDFALMVMVSAFARLYKAPEGAGIRSRGTR